MKKEITDVDSMLKNRSVFNGNIVGSNIDKDVVAGLNMGYSTDDKGNQQMTSGYSSAIEKLASSYKEATAEANALKMAQDGLAESTVKDILAKQNWSEKEINAAISSNAFSDAQKASTAATNADTSATWANVAATKALSVGKKALGILGGVALSAAISVGISALVKLADSLITTKKELREAAETAKQNIDDIKESFNNLESTTNSIKERYAELAQGIDQISGKNLSLSNDDYNEFLGLSNQLAELFPTLTKNYDSNGNAILDLSGNVNSIVSSLDALVKKQRDLANEEMLEKLPGIYTVYTKDISSYGKQLDEAKKKQEDYLKIYNQLKNAEYEVSSDKKAVTFHFGNISEEEKSKLANDLTNSFDDLNDYIIQDIGTLGNHDSTITLYLDKEFNGFEARLKSAQEEINKYTSKIESEVSSFNSYINTWLDGNWVYQQDESIQSALKQVLFNKDWIGLAKDSLGEDAEWDEIAQWLEDNYIKAISNIEDKNVKQKFIDLFTMNLSPQETINIAQELQDYFDEKKISVSLDFILNPDDPNSTQNLVNRVTERNNKIAGSLDELKGKYEELKKARETTYSDSNYVGNVDINNRPIVTNPELGGDYQTSYTGFQEFKNTDGTYEIIHFTPILPDGTILDDDTLYNYLDNIIATSQNKLESDKVENGGLGILYKVDASVGEEKITDENLNKAFEQAENWDIQMHQQQAEIYDKEASALINYNEALDEHNKLSQYFESHSINTDDGYNKWLEITDGAENITQAMYLYDQYLNNFQKEDVGFFTDTNLEAIDAYKNKISDLSGYLEKINTDHKLSAEDLSELNTTYGISADTLEEYEQAIIKEMNEASNNSIVMTALSDAIETCNDAVEKARLESLYEALKNVNVEAQKTATSFENLSEAVNTLDSSASLLRDLKEEIDTTGNISFSSSDDILSAFPEMAEDVALFNAGLINSDELFAKLEQAYQNNVDEYANAIESELQYNEEFYDHIIGNVDDWIIDMAESYDINLSDYKTLNEEKLALDKEYAKRKAVFDEALLKNEAINDVLQSPESKNYTADDYRKALGTHEAYLVAQSDLENIQAIIDAVDSSFDVNASWDAFGKDDNSGSKDDGTEIDWADQSLKVLQDEVDKFQTAFDNTKGITNQIEAIDDLNDALEKLKGGYQSAYDEYEDRYTTTISGLSSDIRNKIESGEEFDLSKYNSNTAEQIQNAIEYYNNMQEALAKIDELSETISINDNIEKSKLLQQSYESQLETINTKLDDQTLSVDEKNVLLNKQLKLQNKINKELRKQAKYEGDFETVSKLDAEDKNNKLQNRLNKLQEKKDENQVYIDTYDTALEDTSLTSEDINSFNNLLQDATNKDFKYQFNEKIAITGKDTWEDYITSLKEKYSEQNMKDKEFIKKHLDEISKYFSYTGMEELYYEYLNSERDFKQIDYDTKKNERSYYINDSNNDIQDIQNDIDYQGGRGTESQYKTLSGLYQNNKNYWVEQRQEAQAMLSLYKAGTAEWDKWNSEIQECDDNIASCERSIKDCNIEILKLPLNDVEDELRDIENQLDDVNKQISDYETYISASNFILDTQIKAQELIKEGIQDEIDALEKTNDLRQANLEIQQAEYNLEKLRNQKTEKIFKEGQGFVYEANVDDLKEAQKQLDEAIYNKKIADLNQQIVPLDEEIKKLNKIKDKWSEIGTNAQGSVDLNKALSYDSDFFNKVLTGDTSLIQGIQNNMTSLFTSRDELEVKQEKYQKLQDIINDTIEAYDNESISYELASLKISDAIKTYYPELSDRYDSENTKIQEIIDKKKTDAEITKEKSDEINTIVEEANQKMLENYIVFKEELSKVFNQLNSMLQTYSENAIAMASSVSSAVSQIQAQINSLSSLNSTISITGNDNNVKGKKKNTKDAGNSHSGLELGYIGEGNLSQDKKAFKYIALSELNNDEVVRVLQRGEGVLNSSQIQNVMSNFRNIAQAKVPALLPSNQANQSTNFNGDIIINNPVGDSSKLAHEIKRNLSNAMLQQLHSNK